MRLGVSPTAISTPTGVFSQRFEALFPHTGILGCMVCLVPQLFLPVYLPVNVGPSSPPTAASVTSCSTPHPAPQSATLLGAPTTAMSSVLSARQLPVSAPPTSLDECFFFNSLVVRLPYSSIFCQFWGFFVFKFVVVLLLVVQGGNVYLPTPPSRPEV